ncbi:hypothetical protein HYX08_03020 [Candidatus Woesearchaeota archaeon]|nr:hypothetical protein [Candidatus Woesearchaeota archaeon]
MKLHQQFDLNLGVLKVEKVSNIPSAIGKAPVLVDKLVRELAEKGYIVMESSIRYMGVPQSITVIKDFTGPFASLFSSKMRDDFRNISRELGMDKLFD